MNFLASLFGSMAESNDCGASQHEERMPSEERVENLQSVSDWVKSATINPPSEYDTNLHLQLDQEMSSVDVNWSVITPIMDILTSWNMEEHIDEVLCTIFGVAFSEVRNEKGIKQWTSEELAFFIGSLTCLDEEGISLAEWIRDEYIDGEGFMYLRQSSLKSEIKLSLPKAMLLDMIFSYWALGIDYTLPEANLPNIPLGVLGGYIADLRGLTVQKAEELIKSNEQSATTGEGAIYGQLLAIGYSEYRMIDKKWVPFGLANTKFTLKRRNVPNGLLFTILDARSAEMVSPPSPPPPPHHRNVSLLTAPHSRRVSNLTIDFNPAMTPLSPDFEDTTRAETSSSGGSNSNGKAKTPQPKLTYRYVNDPCHDRFQIGRAVRSTNDFIVPGPLHLGDDGIYTGPVSRWAVRIECERLPPYRTFIYAGGFNDHKELSVRGVSSLQDGFSTYGVRIFQPEEKQWLEVSVLGRVYESRLVASDRSEMPRKACPTQVGNQLTDGTLIDICGCILMFQDPISMARQRDINPEDVIMSFNAQKPQCPVQFNEIRFSFISPHERIRRAVNRIYLEEDTDGSPVATTTGGSGGLGMRYTPLHVPTTDYSHITEESRTYVFTNCGHVYGYHKMLENRPCPCCRANGPFMPIAFPFESAICDQIPTHVFNPCGHIASLETCKHWSMMHLPPFPGTQNGESVARCPFCYEELNRAKPYSKMILLQTLAAVDETSTSRSQSEDQLTTAPSSRSRSYSGSTAFYDSKDSDEYLAVLEESQRQLFRNELGQVTARSSLATLMTGSSSLSQGQMSYPVYAPQVVSKKA